MNVDDMVIMNNNQVITSGGYAINSAFLNNEVPVSFLLNKKQFGGLSVPSGLIYMSNNSKMTNELDLTGGTIEKTVNDNLYESLIKILNVGGKNIINSHETLNEPDVETSEAINTENIISSKSSKSNKHKFNLTKTNKKVIKKTKKYLKQTKKLNLRPSI